MCRQLCLSSAALFALTVSAPYGSHARTLTFEDRVAAQRSIEDVYWRHRVWPKENPQPKPALDATMPDDAIRAKVLDYLGKSNALEEWWQRPITGDQLQAEMDRMAKGTRDPAMLRDLFAALGDDPLVIAETLARQTLAERLVRSWYASDARFHGDLKRDAEAALAACHDVVCMKSMGGEYRETTWRLRGEDEESAADEERGAVVSLGAEEWKSHLDRLAVKLDGSRESVPTRELSAVEETADRFSVTAVLSQGDGEITTAVTAWPKRSFDAWWEAEGPRISRSDETSSGSFVLPSVALTGCTNDTWTPTPIDVPDPRAYHTAVWTGTEMIVWGGYGPPEQNTGGRYTPSTDTWVATSTGANVPSARSGHTVVWTGTEMIIWGGSGNTGGRYTPSTDRWTATSTGANAPSARFGYTVVWTGTEMIVWGGGTLNSYLNTGGRYNPTTDSWTATSTGANVPVARVDHSAVWTGTEMIVWGGSDFRDFNLNTGGRYNPLTNTWTATSTGANVPATRDNHTAVWTGTEMIIWGGYNFPYLNTGGRYNPSTDSWAATSTGVNVPSGRWLHTAVWTGAEMIIWGGGAGTSTNTGGRYLPAMDRWIATSTGANVPDARSSHTAVWTGTEMIIWGGLYRNTGGRYDPSSDSWVPTSMGTSVPALRNYHTAVWTGTEMIVWGGAYADAGWHYLNTGGRYSPSTDSWTVTSTGANVPSARTGHTAVWTGTEMIIWGGGIDPSYVNTGGRYNPSTDSWKATSTKANVPSARTGHTAVWTGTEMIIWGGSGNTGGRYDPSTDTWTPTSTGANIPSARGGHTAVWTGTEMTVWGGGTGGSALNTGGRYSPSTDTWTTTSTGANVPTVRGGHTAVWTGTEMIVWGGSSDDTYLNTGGRYNPSTDAWTATSTGANVPVARWGHNSVWTGADMIVWGGDMGSYANTGGRYNPSADAWTVTSTGANVPFARWGHTAVWTGTEMIVWGGYPRTSTGGRYCACPGGRILHRDADGDGHGDPGVSIPSCDGSIPPGTVTDGLDCDDSNPAVHPGAAEVCDGLDNDCNGLLDEDAQGVDSDGDEVRNACDNCPSRHNPGQSDLNADGIGDICDLGDGVILVLLADPDSIEWQQEAGFAFWNVYEGDLDVLKATHVYTQSPGSNALAERHCGLPSNWVDNLDNPVAGKTAFMLVTGIENGAESSLGEDSRGVERPNTNPCP